MNITTNDDWTWVGDEQDVAYATTSDPRVLAVIERQEDWGGGHIDGDSYAPAWYWDTWREELTDAGSTFRDSASEHIMSRLADARYRFRVNHHPFEVVERWLRIYHETVLEQVKSTIDAETQVIILSTPTWREHVGGVAGDPLRKDALGEDVEAWEAALSGNVYGIGYATNESHLMDGDDIDFEEWTMNIGVYGFLGEEYAKRSAAEFEYETPSLPELLDFDPPHEIEYTDRMANARVDGL